METRVHTYGDVTENARHGTSPHTSVQFNTTMAFVALFSLVYDSNQSKTKRKAIVEVLNQTVKSVFEQWAIPFNMHTPPMDDL